MFLNALRNDLVFRWEYSKEDGEKILSRFQQILKEADSDSNGLIDVWEFNLLTMNSGGLFKLFQRVIEGVLVATLSTS